jgi:hypothetical protein
LFLVVNFTITKEPDTDKRLGESPVVLWTICGTFPVNFVVKKDVNRAGIEQVDLRFTEEGGRRGGFKVDALGTA